MRYFEKTALNAQKARILAKSVGVIPHPESQWKWAVSLFRKKNPSGLKNTPLMMSGKELSDAKNKMGLIPNNLKQKLISAQRRAGGLSEAGLTVKGDIVVGKKGIVPYQPGVVLRAHTHPEGEKYRYLKTEETNRFSDPVLISSPSGRPYGYNNQKRNDAEHKLEKLKQKITKNPELEESLRSNKAVLQGKVDRANSSLMRLRGDMITSSEDKIVSNIISPKTTSVYKFKEKHPLANRIVYFKGGFE